MSHAPVRGRGGRRGKRDEGKGPSSKSVAAVVAREAASARPAARHVLACSQALAGLYGERGRDYNVPLALTHSALTLVRAPWSSWSSYVSGTSCTDTIELDLPRRVVPELVTGVADEAPWW